MQSRLKEALGLRFEPVAVLLRDERPEGAVGFAPGRRGCVMWLFAQAALGRTAAISRETAGCPGGLVGLGFETGFEDPERHSYFLSCGVEGTGAPVRLVEEARAMPASPGREHLLHGERYWRDPAAARAFLDGLPTLSAPPAWVVLVPLPAVPVGEEPAAVVFIADGAGISGLVTLAHYRHPAADGVIVPPGAGCMQFFLWPLAEATREHPRAVIGMTDPSARVATKRLLGTEVLTFAVPWSRYLEFEEDVAGSFLETAQWRELIG
ncbi:MAG TPA: DUF169 domain-containing protein [Methanoregulaceae archaeon]|nr:DUF169 domain-containing protein [Methanoregulaceae archaeon]HQJ88145.1 DUF169 domain-containing protein [Methanoregulaceae archaeon]